LFAITNDAAAQAGGRISRKVEDQFGDPIEGVQVTAISPDRESFKLEKTTNKKGKFVLAFADSTASYVIELKKEGYETIVAPINPELAAAHTALAAVAHMRGDYAGAAEEAEKALAIEPTDVRAMQIRYDAYRLAGNNAKAKEEEKALRELWGLSDSAARIFNEGADAYNSGDMATAISKFQQAADLDPTLVQARLVLAKLFFSEGNLSEGLVRAEEAVALEPDNPEALRIAYDSARRLGKTESTARALDGLAASDPVFHGVRDNGNYVVPAELTTMAELLSDAGDRTGAFVGAFVLSSRWGLDQGFESYTEPQSGYDSRLVSFSQIQRRAEDVIDDALAWLAQEQEAPWFAWVHLYDPHLAYDPPPAFAREYPDDPYLGEVAYADAELSRLQSFLETSGLEANTLVIFAGDHGEGLGDHGEHDHGLLLYQTTSRVPLIIHHPDAPSSGVRREEVVSLVDILPTVVGVIGVPPPGEIQGQSLWPLIGGEETFNERPAYAETRYPKLHFGWSPLTVLQDRRFQLIQSSDPELYDLENDPLQNENTFATNPSVADRMTGDLEDLIELLEANDSLVDGWVSLGKLYRNQGPMAEALEAFAEANEKRPQDPFLVSRLANALISAQRPAEAERYLLAAQEKHPDNPLIVFAMARVMESTGRPAEAEGLFRQALTLDPHVSEAQLFIGQLRERQNRIEEAAQAYRNELANSPASLPAAISLSRLEGRRGRFAEQERVLRNAIRTNPRSPDPYLMLAMTFLQREERYPEAVELAHLALERGPKGREPQLNYLLLADLYNRLGDSEREHEYARLGRSMSASGGEER
jgi:tetratricopeptide (TPR) repeat protein